MSTPPPGPPAFRLHLGLVALLLFAIVTIATWPQVPNIATSVTDFGDPLLDAWALAWVGHALVTQPARMFDANIFFPETDTLAYSEALLLPGLAVAPIVWLTKNPILALNVLLLAGYVLSGLATFVLVRSLTKRSGAAFVAAVIFAIYPYRIEQYAHVPKQLTFWWPIALLAIHKLVTAPRLKQAIVVGLLLAADLYTCLYNGIFGGIVIATVAVVAALLSRARARSLGWLAVSAAVTIALTLPLAGRYLAASRVVGERSFGEVTSWSADLVDYRRAHPENARYGDDRHPGPAERRLFPGYVTPLLALSAFVAPVAPATWAYAAGGIVAFDLSLGAHVPGYRWLYDRFTPLRALRVPARFGMVLGLVLAVLAGFGVSRWPIARAPGLEVAVVVLLVAAVTFESRMRPQQLVSLADPAPAVYTWLAGQPRGVVCEYPVGHLEGRAGPQDTTYMYYSTRHWMPLVNGFSGFAPASYLALLDGLRHFPDDGSIDYLESRGVRYLLVHGPFYIRGNYAADVSALRARADLRWVGRFGWKHGGTSDVFLLPAGDTRAAAH